jgi:hypothetical protein
MLTSFKRKWSAQVGVRALLRTASLSAGGVFILPSARMKLRTMAHQTLATHHDPHKNLLPALQVRASAQAKAYADRRQSPYRLRSAAMPEVPRVVSDGAQDGLYPVSPGVRYGGSRMSAFAISHPGTGPYKPGDRVRVVFPICLVKHGKPVRYEGVILGAFNTDYRIWRVLYDGESTPELVHASFITWLAAAGERRAA